MNAKKLALEIVTPLLVIALIWWWTSGAESYYYPPLGDIFRAFADTWVFERFSADVLPSLGRLAAGYVIAAVLGIALGVVLGRQPTLRRMATPIVEFLRAIPAPALIPFAILVLGVENDAKIFLIAVVCVFPILLNTIDGVAGVEPTLLDTTRVYRIGRLDRLRYVVLPAAAPQIFAGLRTSLSLSLILMVISEMVASSNGIGYFILQSQRSFAITEMWSGILLLGLLGYLFNAVFTLVERRVLAWHIGARAGAQ
ncbi:ABC transporter permease [Solirubrobacter phytolaccae]|uniref:ABC transporter permease n=1 Tax=Solirubrobacter phytolaccae TaxID=1404360 RepID=A0A9X3SAU7_9ACTN|nr:ABC transporter permease [Solirubrobacter phytolaccae]MDA0182916.1 ABC transporter permease [Solirubrobacter phytolaccae]